MDHGVHIFVEFFERFPDNQKHFPKFQGVPISKINVSVISLSFSFQSQETYLLYVCMQIAIPSCAYTRIESH